MGVAKESVDKVPTRVASSTFAKIPVRAVNRGIHVIWCWWGEHNVSIGYNVGSIPTLTQRIQP